MPLPEKVLRQLEKAGLPRAGHRPFRPRLTTNRRGETIVARAAPAIGPRRRRVGWVDEDGNIWIRDPAHAGLPDHWDVQLDGGRDYVRVGVDGRTLSSPAPPPPKVAVAPPADQSDPSADDPEPKP